MPRTRMDELFALAEEHDGLLTSKEARAAGIQDSVLVRLAQRGRLERMTRGVYRIAHYLCFEDGQLQVCSENREEQFGILNRLESWIKADLTFADYLEQEHIPDSERKSVIGYVEGFNAADSRIIGIAALGLQQAAEDTIEGDRMFRLRDGYDRLPQFIAKKLHEAGGRIFFHTLVERVEWNHGHVRIEANTDGQPTRFEARQAVIALPLGVLQQQTVTFFPVPAPIHEAHRLRMGRVRRFTLLFREKFWGQLEPSAVRDLGFLFSLNSMPPVWWTSNPAQGSALTGWVGGPRSEALMHLNPDELGKAACDELATIFSLSAEYLRNQLIRCVTHDWQRDALSLGAYSYIPAGALDACSKMTLPADDTLYFAGEHTDTTGHWGTVHAAVRSGLCAAQQILSL
jgi:monoamine oxidase